MLDLKSLGPLDYLRILWHRKWYFLVTATAVSAAGLWYAWIQPHIYRSQARIRVQTAFMLEESATMANRDRTEDRINAIRDLIQSRVFIEKMVEHFGLLPPGSPATMESIVRSVRNKIHIDTVSSSTFVLSYQSPNPQFARDMTEQLTVRLIDENKRSRQSRANAADQFLEAELAKVAAELRAQEEKITAFKNAHLGALPEQGTANMNALSTKQSQLAALETAITNARRRQDLLNFQIQERNRIEALESSLPAAQQAAQHTQNPNRGSSTLATQLAAKQAELSSALAKYTEKHPDLPRLNREVAELQKKVDAENQAAAAAFAAEQRPQTVPALPNPATQNRAQSQSDIAQLKFELDSLKNEIAEREKERLNILSSIKVYQERLDLAPALEQQLMGLNRELEGLKTKHENLQSRMLNVEMSARLLMDSNNESYVTIDHADLPERPIGPNRAQYALAGLAAAFALGLGAAFAREFLDPTVATAEEAASVLGLPVLISIPEIAGDSPRGKRRLLQAGSPTR